MFKNQSVAIPQDAVNIQHQNFSQAKDLKIEDIPIYTMAQDIYEIEHPNEKNDASSDGSAKTNIDFQSLTEKQKTSPFLNPATAPQPEINIAPVPVPNQPAKQELDQFNNLDYVVLPEKPKPQPQFQDRLVVEPKDYQSESQIQSQFQSSPESEPQIQLEPQFQPEPVAELEQEPEIDIPTAPTSEQEVYPLDVDNTTYTEKEALMNKNGVFAILIAIVILIITGTGVYYFLSTRQTTPETVAVLPTPAPIVEPVIQPTPPPVVPVNPEPKTDLSATKPNYMPVDIENSDILTLKNTISDYVKKTQESGLTTPLEFLIVDLKNNPVGFEVFAKKLGLTFSTTVLSDLGSEFSLFIYNDQSDMRLGLTINAKNDIKLKTDLVTEEKTLAANLKPIFIPAEYKFDSTTFGAGSYNEVSIKYSNASIAKNLSLDYAITNKQLIIGTSKMTTRTIIDYTISNSTTKITTPTPTAPSQDTSQKTPQTPTTTPSIETAPKATAQPAIK